MLSTPHCLTTQPCRATAGPWALFLVLALLLSVFVEAFAQGQEAGSANGDAAEVDTDLSTDEQSIEEVTPTEAQQRELDVSEDPLQADQQKRKIERAADADEVPEETRTTGFDLYGSLRYRYRYRGQDSEAGFEDGGSRAGVQVDWQFREGSYLYTRYEAGFNVLTGLKNLANSGERSEEFEDTVFTRLWYAGIESPWVSAIAGKNWSTYYQVAGFTDRFQGTGGSASGAFNAQTDGGPTGPGRADRTVQTQVEIDFLPQRYFRPFKLNLQVQHGNDIPFGEGASYGTAYGISAILHTRSNLKFGLAYNHARVDLSENPALRGISLDGDARAALLGVRSFGARWYAGLVVSRLENHETTDDGIYFDGWGSEFYGQYRLLDRFWVVGGYNVLKPDGDQALARDYEVKYGVVGVRYTFDGFTRMIWANARIDTGANADGSAGSNVYTIGIRWDFTKRGWHLGT